MMVVEIRGCGLAGVCVGWWLWRRGVEFCFVGERGRGASWAAAGLMNPVTGKGMNVSWETGRFLGEAKRFYREVEAELGREYFRESGVLRVFRSGEEREKFAGKRGELAEWVGDEFEEVEGVKGGEFGGVCWEGGGWLGVRDFVRDSLAFFGEGASGEGPVVFCEGAKGLREGPFSFLPTRLAKGEILTLRVPGWGEERILNRGGWVIPLGEDLYRVGATYEWDDLSEEVTEGGREAGERLFESFVEREFEVVEQVAGVRPIVRNSQPVVGLHPEREDWAILNGLGSKGCLSAPSAAEQLVNLVLDGVEVEEGLRMEGVLK